MERMPAVYLSHGAPPLADDLVWPRQLAEWAATMPQPEAILMVSAHWEEAPIAVGATTTVPLVYDFWGFPQKYYEVRYPAPGAPWLAGEVRRLLGAAGSTVQDVPDRGLDHGAYVPLAEMYPAADVPVLQLSIPTLDPRALMGLGRDLAPLRDQGVLIIGSGFFTHNLRVIGRVDGPGDPRPGTAELAEFDEWGREALDAGEVDALVDFQHKAPAAHVAHPRTDHWVPLYVVLGAAENDLAARRQRTVIDGFWFANAKRSIQIG